MLGNSSAGILEAPLLKLPVINVGNRQKVDYMLRTSSSSHMMLMPYVML